MFKAICVLNHSLHNECCCEASYLKTYWQDLKFQNALNKKSIYLSMVKVFSKLTDLHQQFADFQISSNVIIYVMFICGMLTFRLISMNNFIYSFVFITLSL